MEKARKENFGIHAQKLPQYADEQSLQEKKYWKKQRNYFANPKHASHLQMKQDRQFWAKNDELLLNDLTLEPYSKKDAFKASYHPLPKPKDFADKALTKNYVNADKKLPNKKGKTSLRFTEQTLPTYKPTYSLSSQCSLPLASSEAAPAPNLQQSSSAACSCCSSASSSGSAGLAGGRFLETTG